MVKSTQLSGRVLVVDAEEDLRTVMGQHLTNLGMDVTMASSGREAQEILRKHEGKFDLVIVDLNLSSAINGRTLVNDLNKIRTRPLKILAITGDFRIVQRKEEYEVDGFLVKPFGFDELVSVVKKMLDS